MSSSEEIKRQSENNTIKRKANESKQNTNEHAAAADNDTHTDTDAEMVTVSVTELKASGTDSDLRLTYSARPHLHVLLLAGTHSSDPTPRLSEFFQQLSGFFSSQVVHV